MRLLLLVLLLLFFLVTLCDRQSIDLNSSPAYPQIFGPDDRIHYSATRETENRYSFSATHGGLYKYRRLPIPFKLLLVLIMILFRFCFSNTMSTVTSKTVSDIRSPARPFRYFFARDAMRSLIPAPSGLVHDPRRRPRCRRDACLTHNR